MLSEQIALPKDEIKTFTLTVKEIKEVLQCATNTVYSLIDSGKLHPIPNISPLRFLPDEVLMVVLRMSSEPAMKGKEAHISSLVDKYEKFTEVYGKERLTKLLYEYMIERLAVLTVKVDVLDLDSLRKAADSALAKEIVGIKEYLKAKVPEDLKDISLVSIDTATPNPEMVTELLDNSIKVSGIESVPKDTPSEDSEE